VIAPEWEVVEACIEKTQRTIRQWIAFLSHILPQLEGLDRKTVLAKFKTEIEDTPDDPFERSSLEKNDHEARVLMTVELTNLLQSLAQI